MNKTFAFYLYKIGQFVRQEPVFERLNELQQSCQYSLKQLTQLQETKLEQVYTSALNTKFYKNKYKDVKNIDKITVNLLNHLPILEKDEVRRFGNDMLNPKRGVLAVKKITGGTTGQPLITIKDRVSTSYQRAAMYRGYGWAGVGIGDKQIRFWGVPLNQMSRFKYKLIDYFMNRIRLSAFNFSDEDLADYYRQIIKFKPDYFYGYTSMLFAFADYMNRNSLDGHIFNLKAVISTSEVLHDFQRELLERVFGCKVFNEYGSGEFGPIAFECKNSQLHINAENVLVEIAKETGDIIITELNNTTMPLIRYRIGDVGSISDKQCFCGCELPVLEKVTGRVSEFVITSENKKIHGEYFNYLMEEKIQLKETQIIKQFQIHQSGIGYLDFLIVKDKNYNSDSLKKIDNILHDLLGLNTRIEYKFVDSIPPAPSGKRRLVVSQL